MKHPLYNRYSGMVRRCNNPKDVSYSKYGGRGIRVCDEWLGANGFRNFVADMGFPPEPWYTLDRIDNNGDYEPTNVRWATPRQQVINRRPQKPGKSGYRGVYWYKPRQVWIAVIRENGIVHKLGFYDDPRDAALAYDKAVRKYHGPDGQINFPVSS